MNRGKRTKERTIRAFFSLFLFLPYLVSCSAVGIESVKSQKVPSPDQVPLSQATTETMPMSPYVLEVGDEVNIKLAGFDNNSMDRTSVQINNSGEIYYPLIGAVKLGGLTVPKARELLVTRLKKYIVDPQVEFTTTTNRQTVYVFGEVNTTTSTTGATSTSGSTTSTTGVVSFKRPLLVTEAIAKAGWFNRDANRKNVLVIRRADNKFNVYSVNTGDALKDGSNVTDFYLQAGDMVYVPPMGVVKLERFLAHIQNIAQPFLTVEQAVVLWPTFFNVLTGKTTTSSGLAISTTQPQ